MLTPDDTNRSSRVTTVRRWDYGSIFISIAVILVGIVFPLADATTLARTSTWVDRVVTLLMQLPAWLLWRMAVYPCLKLHPDGLVVVNSFRVWRIPWGQIVSIDAGKRLCVHLADGRRVKILIARSSALDFREEFRVQKRIRAQIEQARLASMHVNKDPVTVRVDLCARIAIPIIAGCLLYALAVAAVVD